MRRSERQKVRNAIWSERGQFLPWDGSASLAIFLLIGVPLSILKELLTGRNPARESGQEGVFKTSRVKPDRATRCSKSHGTGRVGSGGFQMSRVGPGRSWHDPTGREMTLAREKALDRSSRKKTVLFLRVTRRAP